VTRRRYVNEFGPGFCRNGHSRGRYGVYANGGCRECMRLQNARKRLRRKNRARLEGNLVDVPIGW
jgi:hypothetical protein